MLLVNVTIVMTLSAAAATALAAPAKMIVSFDQGLDTSTGTSPVVAEDLLTTTGRDGMAGLFLEGASLAYPVGDAYNPARGSISLWVQPTWSSDALAGDVYFWGIEHDPSKENRTVLGFLGRDGRGTVYFGPDGALGGLAASVDWRKGEWHHIKVCWDTDRRCAALYIDGVRRHTIEYSARMPGEQDRFYIGGLPCTTRWMGVPDNHEALAAIDNFELSNEVSEPDFDQAVKLAEEDAKARKRYEAARDAAEQEYMAVFDRLREGITLDRVARERIEVSWDDLTGMGAALTQRVPIQARIHYDPIFVHPDLSIAMGIENDSLGLGVALGAPFELPDMYTVTRSLHDGYLPIVNSVWNASNCRITEEALAFLPGGAPVTKGDEPQYVCVRLTITNTSSARMARPLYVLVGEMGGQQNTNYQPFLASASRWMAHPLNLHGDVGQVSLNANPFVNFGGASPTVVHTLQTGTTDPLMPVTLSNVLQFDLALEPGASTSIEFVASTSPRTVDAALPEVRFEDVRAQVAQTWNDALAKGAAFTTPEPRLNDIYKTLIVSSLQNMTKRPGRPYVEPNQVPVWRAVWPWEFVHMSIPLSELGFHDALKPAFRFFTERQTGIGEFEEPGRGPEGDIHSTYGCYSGNFLLRWMCETGAVLWGMAENFRYSGDTEWLAQNKESILAAWDWVQGERMRTRRYDANGRPQPYYGLLPRGRVHDWNEWHFFMTFSDNYTWKGMSEMALAFQSARFPEAPRMIEEAAEYRQCILDAVEHAQFIDPETGLQFVPNLLFFEEGERGGVWWADGPTALFGTGLLDAATDPRFDSTIAYTQSKWGLLMGMVGSMDESEQPDKRNPLWYVNSPERGLFQNYLMRGETERALLLFYSTLVYGMSHDCYQTVERINVADPNFAPFQPNASGNGRILDMMRRMFVDDQEPGVLHLLRACPRRWFEPGAHFGMEHVPTPYGEVTVQARVADTRVHVTVTVPDRAPLEELRIALRLPRELTPTRATVNDAATDIVDETVSIREPTGTIELWCELQ